MAVASRAPALSRQVLLEYQGPQMRTQIHKFRLFLLLLTVSVTPGAGASEIWECVDRDGGRSFTNIKSGAAGCRPMNLPQLGSMPATTSPAAAGRPSSAPAGSADFPKVDPSIQQQRDSGRRRILEQELANEERLLEQARRDLAEQEGMRLGNERNYQRVLDRIEPFRRKVAQHESNIAGLRREISGLR
jgi:hypothetical protein